MNEIKFLKKLHIIKTKLKERDSFVLWFDAQGKLLAKGLNTKDAKSSLLNLIIKNRMLWKNKIITEVVIEFDPDNIMEEALGGLQISINLNKIVFHDNSISIQQKNKTNSLFTLRYRYDELEHFKLSDLKKFALFVSNEELKTINPFKIYHYSDML